MPCTRCGGLLVVEAFPDCQSSRMWVWGRRCLNCGYIEDPVIRRNRQQPSLAG